MELKKTCLVLLEDFLVLLLGLVCPSLRWMFSEPDLLQRVWTVASAKNFIVHHFWGDNTSFALSLQAWISDASIFSNSSMSATMMSPFQILPAYNT